MDSSTKKPRTPKAKLQLPLPTPADYRSFVTTVANLRATLDQHGVAVVEGVLTDAECTAMVDGAWQFFEQITRAWAHPIRRNDEDSWRGFFRLYPMHSMLVQHWGIGHAQYLWELRQNPQVVAIFASLYGVAAKDLLVSFDGASFHLPHENTGRGAFRGNTWFHTDQRLSDSTPMCVQSWVTGLDVRPGDATLTVLRGSHAHHAEFATLFHHDHIKEDWYKLASQAELDWFVHTKGCERVSITCPAGSLVLWDSRTMHAGQESMTWRAQPSFRIIGYLCYVPRTRATAAQLKKKRAAYEARRTTSHWPERVKLFGKNPRTYGAELPAPMSEADAPVLTDLGRRLAGY